MISFEQWCLENNRLKTLSLWDYEKNCSLPSDISPRARKRIYIKCPNCGSEWMVKLRELSDPLAEEISCTLCEKRISNGSEISIPETKEKEKEKKETAQRHSLISEKIGVVETVVTAQDEIAAVGVAIVETDGFRIINAALWKIYLYGDYPDVGESLCYPELTNKKSFFYSKYKSVIDNASIHEGTKADCISGLKHYLSQFGVTLLFAYNGKKIKQQLIALEGVDWFDLTIPFTSFRINQFITPNRVAESYVKSHYKVGEYRVEEDGRVWYKKWPTEYFREFPTEKFITTGKAGLCLKAPEELDDIIKCVPGCENYKDTPNVLYRAIDRAAIMELLQISIGAYAIGRLKDSNKDVIKRKEQLEQYQRERIPFDQIVAMSYEELVEYLRVKYGPVKYDYFSIEPKRKIDESESLNNILIKRGNTIYFQEKEYPVGVKYTHLVDDDFVDYTSYMVGTQRHSVFEPNIYWYYPGEELYIAWNRNKKNSRAAEGLVIHHIDEDKAENLAEPEWACEHPIEYQRKERLIYCDFIEHYLLHLKCGSKCGTELIERDIWKFISRMIDHKWQIPCARRVWSREKDVVLLVEKGMVFREDDVDKS